MQLIDAKQAAQVLNVRTSRLYELVRMNLVPHVRVGIRQIRFDEEALSEWSKRGGGIKQGTSEGREGATTK
ncbi:MAG TPA: helix-turn-helix domain-containing protein [Pyrinomonadaceae bacterium]|nr:helix-turn-helix domain-containing protein [Pyrinomonadaceae bacterium]